MKFIYQYYETNKFIHDCHKIYKIDDRKEIEKIQLYKFNYIWQSVIEQFEFYKNYKIKNNLPKEIVSLKQLDEFPIINKFDINENFKSILKNSKTKNISKTGGTSGLVSYFPTGKIDSKYNFNRQVFLRKNFQINPDSKCLYIWGHSHKFNDSYLKIIVTTLKKGFKNFYFNRKQISAYEFTEKNLAIIVNNILTNKFKYIISYGSTLDILVKFIKTKYQSIDTKIKFISTSETVSNKTIIDLKNVMPNLELINEFGMAETGVIGYNRKDNFEVISNLWNSFLIQKKRKNKIVITTLDKKVFPLINYDPDDLIETDDENSVLNFRVKGKERPIFNIKSQDDNLKISSIIFDHIFKNINGVFSVQYFYDEFKEKLFILYCSNINYENSVLIKIISEKLNFTFKNIFLEKLDQPIKTIAGKFKYILSESDLEKIIK